MCRRKKLGVSFQRRELFWAILGLLVIFLVLLPARIWADTHYVSKSGLNNPPYTTPADASTSINAAIAEASYGDDVLILDAGTYREHIWLRSGILVHSTCDSDSCESLPKIVGTGSRNPIVWAKNIQDAGIECCWIKDGNAANGAGIYVDHSTNITVNRCCVSNNKATIGGGIFYRNNSSGAITNNRIFSNDALVMGAGIACDGVFNLTIQGNAIGVDGANAAGTGGGIWCNGAGTDPAIGGAGADEGNTIENNTAGDGAGIACLNGASPTIQGNNIGVGGANAASKNGGGIECWGAGTNPTIGGAGAGEGNTIENNTATNGAGIACDYGASPTIQGNNIGVDGANAATGDGGGIWCYGEGTDPIIGGAEKGEGNTIQGNTAGGDGGGIFVGVTGPLSQQLRKVRNLQPPLRIVGEIIENRANGDGGGLAIEGADRNVIVQNCIFRGNRAFGGMGGGIFVNPFWGPVNVLIGGNPLQSQNNTFTLNGAATNGGAIAVQSDPAAAGTVFIQGNNIGRPGSGNSANSDGGGIWVSRTVGHAALEVTIDENRIRGNGPQVTHIVGGFVFTYGPVANGGGICITGNPTVTIVDNLIGGDAAADSNMATVDGGGIFCSSSSLDDQATPVVIEQTLIGGPGDYDGNTIEKNIAQTGNGGGICCFGSDPLIQGNEIKRNEVNGITRFPARGGGGIACLAGSTPDIFDNDIIFNLSEWNGGGIFCDASAPNIGGTRLKEPNVINANRAYFNGGGIACFNGSDPAIIRNNIEVNDALLNGGGIYCDNSYIGITDNWITGNWIAGNQAGFFGGNAVGFGGGIGLVDSDPVITFNLIGKNFADADGGGIACTTDPDRPSRGSHPVIRNNTIWHNDAIITGGGLFWDANSAPETVNLNIIRQYGCYDSYAVCAQAPAPFDRNNVFNTIGERFDPVRGEDLDPDCSRNICLNPLFWSEPGRGNLKFRLATNSPCILPGDITIGAYGIGPDPRTIRTLNVPDDFPTIQAAINAANPSDTVLVASGEYPGNITMKSGILLLGQLEIDDGPDATIIKGRITCDNVDNTTIITGFTVRNGGIGCANDADPYIVRNLITANAGVGIGETCRPWIEHNTIVAGNGVSIHHTAPILSHNIIALNQVGVFGDLSNLITWIPNLRGNDVWGNPGGSYGGDMDDRTNSNGNISEDPLFTDRNAPNPDYRLKSDSPCARNSATGVRIGAFPVGKRPDPIGIEEEPSEPSDTLATKPIPTVYAISQNYPNPFNPVTYIRFGLPKVSKVKISVYNVVGQRVAVLVDGQKKAGYHVAEFDSGNLAGGLYFYHIKAGSFQAVKKMLLLK